MAVKILKYVFAAIFVFSPSYASSVEFGLMRLSLLKEDVQIYTEEAGEWAAASVNMPLKEGDRLWAPRGARAEIHLSGETFVRLDGETSLDVLVLEEESVQFYQERGSIYVLNRRGGINHIQVDTPLSSVSGYDNSTVMVDVSEDGSAEVSVVKGYAYVENRGGKTRVSAGNTIKTGADAYAEISPLGPPEEWEKWNRERDSRLSGQTASARYLPDELAEYSYDFDEHGRWVFVREYGHVWTPSVVRAGGWAPYRHGRWVWMRGNYVWVSYEPWGWAPYHYGRWALVAGVGWCWVPPPFGSVYWGPGYVAWVYTPAYVAWVPLAPGEIYYGYGYYGPSSINIIHIDVRRTPAGHKYKNAYEEGAVTTIHMESFLRGAKKEAGVKGNPFLTSGARHGPPDIKPERAAAKAVIKDLEASKLPPKSVVHRSLDEIKRTRRLLRDRESSVFQHEVPRHEMPMKRLEEPKKPAERGERAPSVIKEPSQAKEKKPSSFMRPQTPHKETKEKAAPGVQSPPRSVTSAEEEAEKQGKPGEAKEDNGAGKEGKDTGGRKAGAAGRTRGN